jgi:periplasmic protein TonB
MFDELVESTSAKKKTNTGWAMTLSIMFQVLILGILILIPLIYTNALPKAMLTTLLLAPPPPPPPPPPPAAVQAVKVVKVARLITGGVLTAPRAIPKEVAIFKEAALPDEPAGGNLGVLGGAGDAGLLGGLAAPVAAPPPPPPPKGPTRVTLGGQVQAAKLVTQPQPVYPPLARQARITGQVILHAVIDKDGRVEELEVVSGHPLLVQSALAAVKQWRYQPTLLNGDPVEVDTTITVSFVLGG